MKPSRKERKELANIKRAEYTLIIANEAGRLTKSKPLDKNWVYKLDTFIRDMIGSKPLEAHLIRQAAKKYERLLLKTIKER